MAFEPGATQSELTQKGSLKARWPEAGTLKNLKGLDADAEAQPVINADAAIFNLANSDGDLLRHNFAAALWNGTLGVTQVSVQIGSAADTVRATAEKEKEERRKQDENLRFMRMMKALNDRLAELEKEMADLAVKLRAKYGEDFIGGMAAAHLSEEELGRAQSDEERLKFLAGKFLESDGKDGYRIKEEFKDSDEAKYIKHWAEAQEIAPIVEKYGKYSQYTEEDKNDLSSLKFFDSSRLNSFDMGKSEDSFNKEANKVNKAVDLSSLNAL